MIQSLPNPQAASRWCRRQRARNRTIGYVPTMGALHRGHLALVERAVRENDVACASIFVNPLQFNHPDDLQHYPRDRERDLALLERAGCAMVYGGTLAQFFPEADAAGEIEPPDAGRAARGLEGVFRPGHLQGMCAIVERLFATVGACNAYFGEKDFQQTLVVADLAQRFDGVRVVVCPTVREPSGLALSSRNRHLNPAQLDAAAKLYRALLAAREAWRAGVHDPAELESIMRARLDDARIRVDYAEIRDAENWSENAPRGHSDGALRQARALVAAVVGGVRLIDNLRLDRE